MLRVVNIIKRTEDAGEIFTSINENGQIDLFDLIGGDEE